MPIFFLRMTADILSKPGTNVNTAGRDLDTV